MKSQINKMWWASSRVRLVSLQVFCNLQYQCNLTHTETHSYLVFPVRRGGLGRGRHVRKSDRWSSSLEERRWREIERGGIDLSDKWKKSSVCNMTLHTGDRIQWNVLLKMMKIHSVWRKMSVSARYLQDLHSYWMILWRMIHIQSRRSLPLR